MNGGKPELSPSGEGITSIKITDLFQRGVTHAKPVEASFPIELPVGYTLFNKLVYQIDSTAVASGPNDFVFKVPSATTKEAFDKLRILYAERDSADPEKPRWIDATLMPGLKQYLVDYLSKSDFEKRLPDFKTHTLHAFMEHAPAIFVVASRDAALARDHFVADVSITGAAPHEVMVGRAVIYDLKLMNHGPDTATSISLHADPTFELVAATASQGKCRLEASNVYCNLASLEKGKSLTVRIEEKVRWDGYSSDGHNFPQIKNIEVDCAEGDSNFENNSLSLSTSISEDLNKAPVVDDLVSPKEDEIFNGPDATVPIVLKASDPDGFIDKIEFFDWGNPIGKGTLFGKDEYRLSLKKVSLGRHWLEAIITDNLGRETRMGAYRFFVNGLAKVEISDPKTNSLLERSEGEMSVTVQASHPTLGLKEVKVYLTALESGYGEALAKPVGNDLYVAKIDCSFCERQAEFRAVVIDESGVETRSQPITVKLRRTPLIKLYHDHGEEMNLLEPNQVVDFAAGSTLVASMEENMFDGLDLAKMELYANGKLTDTYVPNPDDKSREIQWDLAGLEPGRYRIQIVVTDTDGSIGKSYVVEIGIKKK